MIFNLIYSGQPVEIMLIMLLCVLASVIISLSLHEFAHAYVAHKCGDDTAKNNGRMTLNPLKHLDVVGFLMLVILGFGFAKAVPINPYNFRKMRRDYFFVSVAGVTVNLVLAFVFSFLYAVVAIFMVSSLFADILLFFFYYMIIINLGLMIFNFIPIFPLDGFRIVESVSGRNNKFVSFMRRYGQYILIGLLVWSFLIGWIIEIVPDSAANVLQYFDILGFTLGFLVQNISSGFISLWHLVFGG